MAEQIKEVIKQEYIKSAQDPAYFMKKYCMIQHPIRGNINFELYDFQEKSVKEFKDNRFNIILKLRRIITRILLPQLLLHLKSLLLQNHHLLNRHRHYIHSIKIIF